MTGKYEKFSLKINRKFINIIITCLLGLLCGISYTSANNQADDQNNNGVRLQSTEAYFAAFGSDNTNYRRTIIEQSLTAGLNRFTFAQMLGLETLPVAIKDLAESAPGNAFLSPEAASALTELNQKIDEVIIQSGGQSAGPMLTVHDLRSAVYSQLYQNRATPEEVARAISLEMAAQLPDIASATDGRTLELSNYSSFLLIPYLMEAGMCNGDVFSGMGLACGISHPNKSGAGEGTVSMPDGTSFPITTPPEDTELHWILKNVTLPGCTTRIKSSQHSQHVTQKPKVAKEAAWWKELGDAVLGALIDDAHAFEADNDAEIDSTDSVDCQCVSDQDPGGCVEIRIQQASLNMIRMDIQEFVLLVLQYYFDDIAPLIDIYNAYRLWQEEPNKSNAYMGCKGDVPSPCFERFLSISFNYLIEKFNEGIEDYTEAYSKIKQFYQVYSYAFNDGGFDCYHEDQNRRDEDGDDNDGDGEPDYKEGDPISKNPQYGRDSASGEVFAKCAFNNGSENVDELAVLAVLLRYAAPHLTIEVYGESYLAINLRYGGSGAAATNQQDATADQADPPTADGVGESDSAFLLLPIGYQCRVKDCQKIQQCIAENEGRDPSEEGYRDAIQCGDDNASRGDEWELRPNGAYVRHSLSRCDALGVTEQDEDTNQDTSRGERCPAPDENEVDSDTRSRLPFRAIQDGDIELPGCLRVRQATTQKTNEDAHHPLTESGHLFPDSTTYVGPQGADPNDPTSASYGPYSPVTPLTPDDPIPFWQYDYTKIKSWDYALTYAAIREAPTTAINNSASTAQSTLPSTGVGVVDDTANEVLDGFQCDRTREHAGVTKTGDVFWAFHGEPHESFLSIVNCEDPIWALYSSCPGNIGLDWERYFRGYKRYLMPEVDILFAQEIDHSFNGSCDGFTNTDPQDTGLPTPVIPNSPADDATYIYIDEEGGRVVENDVGEFETMIFTVHRDGDLSQVSTVDYATSNGTATSGIIFFGIVIGDYVAKQGTLTFEAGESEKEVEVYILGDNVTEADETFLFSLSNATNADLLPVLRFGNQTVDLNFSQGFIEDNDPIDVPGVNDEPTARDDYAETREEEAVNVIVILNDSDPEETFGVRVISVDQPQNGAASIVNTATVGYVPHANFTGEDSFTYTIEDEEGLTSTATVYVTVLPVNDSPTANDDSYVIDQGDVINLPVLANDVDPDGDELIITSGGGLNAAGRYVVSDDKKYLIFTANDTFSGTVNFNYTASDADGESDTAKVTVTVRYKNSPPVANDDSATVDEDSTLLVDVLVNDTDPNDDSLAITDWGEAQNGTVLIENGQLRYTPNADFSGTDSFTYVVNDIPQSNNGPQTIGTDEATVTITVTAVNDAPAANPDEESTLEDTAVIIQPLSNDTDPDGHALNIASASSMHGQIIIASDRQSLTFTPNENYTGTASITYTINDGHGGTDNSTIIIEVNPVQDAPVANNDQAVTEEDVAVDIDVLANDSDPDGDDMTVVAVGVPQNGVAALNVQSGRTTVVYTPNANFHGSDNFTYTISDGNGGTATGTVYVIVASTNDNPQANPDFAVTNEDTSIIVNVIDNDIDLDGEDLTIISVSNAMNGQAVIINSGQQIRYTPAVNFNGVNNFGYTIQDSSGASASSIVRVTIAPVNDSPTAQNDTAITPEDTPINIPVLANDVDVDGDQLIISAVSTANNGSIIISVNNGEMSLSYTPNLNFNGSDNVTYTINDGNGGSATAAVQITVNGVNDVPVARDDEASTNEDIAVDIDVLSNDIDVDGSLTVSSVTQPANGTAEVQADNIIRYIPNKNYFGSDQFQYTVSDGNLTSTAFVSITINSINDAPIANSDYVELETIKTVTVDVLANDRDADGDSIRLVSFTQQGQYGQVERTSDNQLRYIPDNVGGNDLYERIQYVIEDTNGARSSGVLIIELASEPIMFFVEQPDTGKMVPIFVY